MPVTATPIFGQTPQRNGNVWTATSTANTRNDGVGTVGTSMLLCFTAGANGAFVDRIRIHPVGLVAATATTATVGRVYFSTISSGSTTAADTRLWQEVALPSQTAAQTTTATVPIDIPMGIRIAAGDDILFSMHHAAAANTAWQVIVIATDY